MGWGSAGCAKLARILTITRGLGVFRSRVRSAAPSPLPGAHGCCSRRRAPEGGPVTRPETFPIPPSRLSGCPEAPAPQPARSRLQTSALPLCFRQSHIFTPEFPPEQFPSPGEEGREAERKDTLWRLSPSNLRRVCTKLGAQGGVPGWNVQKSAVPAKTRGWNSILLPALPLKFWTWAGGCFSRSATLLRRQEGKLLARCVSPPPPEVQAVVAHRPVRAPDRDTCICSMDFRGCKSSAGLVLIIFFFKSTLA